MSALACDDASSTGGTSFQLVPHACKYCGGRVLRSGDTFRCGGCAAVTMGEPHGICGCGILPGYRTGLRRFSCGVNPERGPKSPSEIVILFGDVPIAAAA